MKRPNKLIFLSAFLCFYLAAFSQFAKQKPEKKSGKNSETFQSFAFDGAWCWFSDPRAVYYEGVHKRTYTGWIDSYGDVFVASYDHTTRQMQSWKLFDKLEVDDHDSPSILIDKQGYIMVFFSKHASTEPIHLIKSKFPEDVTQWNTPKLLDLNDTKKYSGWENSYTYYCPIQLSAENNKIFLFWRGLDGKPTFSTSTDNGENWSTGKIFVLPERSYGFRRPYVKVFSSGKDKIHILFTDGHPRDEKQNSVYYMYYQKGAFFKANGAKIKDISDEAVSPREADVVYDAKLTDQKTWVWDIAEDAAGNPVIAYTKFPTDSAHIYCYAVWNGQKWQNSDLINSGRWFPQTPKGRTEPEPNYSGGISIDKETPNTLYLSVNRDSVFEIEKWTLRPNGKSWIVENITKGSTKDNVRPYAVPGAKADNNLQLLWMQNTRYYHYGLTGGGKNLAFKDRYLTSIKSCLPSPVTTNPLDSAQIVAKMCQAADWQLANPDKSNRTDWLWGAFYVGLTELYKITNDQRYLNELLNVGQAAKWQPLSDIFHADRMTITDVWASLYDITKNPETIDKTRFTLDIYLARGFKNANMSINEKNNPHAFEWWTWCDALYMAPQVFAHITKITGEKKYLDYMNTHWWKTSDYLYSKEDSLYYRDDSFFTRKSKNGKKVFWARGNGWVVGGLVRVLDLMPKDYPDRPKYETQFKEMTTKLLSLQRSDGLWTVSLLDPEELNQGESSGSAFYTFALAWGINNGLIDVKYKSNVLKAWTALTNNINNQGRLGYVQQVAANPFPFFDYQWHVYATGTYFMAGKEILKLIKK
ncbi:MAG: glycoside hydrolase family 88 protein [Bacteroidales bacterium]|nr:glycoside hydrolase family 88 protein [Bacteroidales bacterium]